MYHIPWLLFFSGPYKMSPSVPMMMKVMPMTMVVMMETVIKTLCDRHWTIFTVLILIYSVPTLWARHCFRHLRYISVQNTQKPCPSWRSTWGWEWHCRCPGKTHMQREVENMFAGESALENRSGAVGRDCECGVQGAILNQMLVVVVGLLRPWHLKHLKSLAPWVREDSMQRNSWWKGCLECPVNCKEASLSGQRRAIP